MQQRIKCFGEDEEHHEDPTVENGGQVNVVVADHFLPYFSKWVITYLRAACEGDEEVGEQGKH